MLLQTQMQILSRRKTRKTELKAILDDPPSKPELVGMEDVRKVLMDCGIVVDIRTGQGQERVIDVRLS
jgi:hypothetical protein